MSSVGLKVGVNECVTIFSVNFFALLWSVMVDVFIKGLTTVLFI